MRNILFVYGDCCLQKVGDKYYHNQIHFLVERYRQLGKLTICCLISEVETPSARPVDLSGTCVLGLTKENTIKALFLDRSHNKEVLRREVAAADMVIAHVPSFPSNLVIRYAKEMHKFCLVVVVGCTWDGLWNYNCKGKLLAPYAYLEQRKAVDKADAVIYVTKEFLQHRYPTSKPSIGCSDVAINGLNFSSCDGRKRRIAGWTKASRRNVVTVAGLVPFKGQQYVIRAIAKLREKGYNYHYYMAGSGGNERYLRELAARLDVTDQVHFEGQIAHEQVFGLMDRMDIYIQPSRQDGLPRSVVEAMSLGMPAIVSRVGGYPELVSHGNIFKCGDVDAIVSLLCRGNEVWLKAADQNIKTAADYTFDALDEKRNNFLMECARQSVDA